MTKLSLTRISMFCLNFKFHLEKKKHISKIVYIIKRDFGFLDFY